jgi:hypothetical protein
MSQVSEIFSKEHNSLDKNEEKDRSFSIDSLQYSEESTNLPIDINNEIFSKDINSSENVKNEYNDSSNYCLFLEKPLYEDESVFSFNNSSQENTLLLTNKSSDELIESSLRPNKKIKLNRCNGCYPVFQPNQEGHIGEYGCLGDYYNEFMKISMLK